MPLDDGSETGTPEPTCVPIADQEFAAELPSGLSDDIVLRLAAEQVAVDKRVVETGRVRVIRTTSSHVEKVDVPLSRQTVEVTRVTIGKEVKKMPAVRERRGAIIVPVVEEVLVVQRRLVLREELHIKTVRSVERHTEEIALRRQDATVDRVAAEDSDAGGRSERPSTQRRSDRQPRNAKKRRS